MRTHIFHIADIHIHAQNYAHIDHAWKKLIAAILAWPNYENSAILAIAGDIFDHKMWLQADDITMFKNMLGDLEANKIRTIMMPGNHDYNINQGGHHHNNTSDKVLAIVRGANYKYITHCSLSQVQLIDNLAFFIHSPIDLGTPRPGPEHGQIKKIAMVHEPMTNSKTGSGITFQSQRFSAADFSPVFDITLLGDIHHPQKLAPNVAYSGSFVQKNRGEGVEHGYFLWELATCTGRFIELPQLSSHLKISVKNNSEAALPRISGGETLVARSIQLHYQDCSPEWVAAYSKTVESIYDRPIDEVFNKNANTIVTNIPVIPRSREAIDEAARIGESVPETKLESPMCLESMVSTHMDAAMISPEQRDRVLGLFRTEFSSKTSEFPSVARWRIRHLSWSNALCYGQDNWIDFDSLENMNSVLGPNGIGKSNIIDILILVLYNEVIRGTKKSALNTAACNGHIKCVISIGADVYSIERAWLDANNVVVRLYKNGANASGADMLKTYEEIQRLIGPLRVFLNTALALQQRQFLVDISSKERYELVCRMVDLDRLRAVEDDNKSELRVAKKLLAAIPTGRMQALTARRSGIEAILNETRTELDVHIVRLAALRARQQLIIPDIAVNIPLSMDEIINQVDEIKKLGSFTEYAQLVANRILLADNKAAEEEISRSLQIGRDKLATLKESIRPEPRERPDSQISEIANINIGETMADLSTCGSEIERLGISHGALINDRQNMTARLNDLRLITRIRPARAAATVDSEITDLTSKEFVVPREVLDEIPKLKAVVDSNTKILELLMAKLKTIEANPLAGRSTEPAADIAATEIRIADGEKKILSLQGSRDAVVRFGKSMTPKDIFHYAADCAECAYNKALLTNDSDMASGIANELKNIDDQLMASRADLVAALGSARGYYQSRTKLMAETIKADFENLSRIMKRRDSATENSRRHSQLLEEFSVAQKYEAAIAESADLEIKMAKTDSEIADISASLTSARRDRAKYQTQVELFQSAADLRAAAEVFAANDLTRKKISALSSEIKIFEDRRVENAATLKKLSDWIAAAENHIAKISRADELETMYEMARLAEDAKDELSETNREIENRESTIVTLNGAIAGLTHGLGIVSAEIAAAELEERNRAIQQAAVSDRELLDRVINHKTGIPTEMMKNVCARVEARCNEVFLKIADFSLGVVFDGEVHLNVITKSKDAPGGVSVVSANQASGYQKFIIDIIMRKVLCELTTSGCPSILFVDEGFGSADDNNFGIICSKVLPMLSCSFEKVIVVSHLAGIHEYTTANLLISIDENRKSKIQFGPRNNEFLKIRVLDDHAAHKKATKEEKTLRAAGPKTDAVTEREQKKLDEKKLLDDRAATVGDTVFTKIDAKNIKCEACDKTYKNSLGFAEKHMAAASHQKAVRVWLKSH